MSKTGILKQSAVAESARHQELSDVATTLSIVSQHLAQQADAIPEASRKVLAETAQTVQQTVVAMQKASQAVQTTADRLREHAQILQEATKEAKAPSLTERLTLAVVVGTRAARGKERQRPKSNTSDQHDHGRLEEAMANEQ